MAPDSESGVILDRIDELQEEIYELRRHLSARPRPDAVLTGELSVLVCSVGESRVGILLESVQEAVRIARLTPLPEASPWVPGLLNLRGRLVPVIDLQARVTRSRRKPLLSDLVVVCSLQERSVGVLVQEILGVVDIQATDVEPAPEGVALAPYLLGIAHHDEQPALVISIESLAATSDLPEEEP
jgi:purine-binding chemotaxis protein CheW